MKLGTQTFQKSLVSASILCATVTFSQTGFAAEQKQGFAGNGEFGFSTTTGNTESDSLFAAIKLNYLRSKDEFKTLLEANYQSEKDVTTRERYLLDFQYNRFYSESKSYYSFLGARFEQNPIEEIQLDSTLSLGLGKTLFNTATMKLNGEAGIGYQTIDYTNASGIDSDNQAVARGKLDYQYTINENVDFGQDLIVTSGAEQTKTEANTALKVKLAEQMRLKAGFKYRHNSEPAAGNKKVDTQTMMTLVYDF